MKTTIITSACFALLLASPLFAQDRTTVNAKSSEISDNLDLRAIASIFGDAKNLEDFERQLNDPKIQISNLDLNEDNQVDYLRVIESVEDNTHLIVIQSVLGKDTFQDVATIEVERDRNNNVQVQVVGDVYMYGQNYIYEPVYVTAPIIYTTFWTPIYRPYYSAWYWNYYPTYYYAWNPCPVFRYRNNINVYINFNNHYNYVTTRRCDRAVVMHQHIRANYYERTYPTRAFAYRNNNVNNRYELDQTRKVRTVSTRNDVAYSNPRNGRNNDPIKNSTVRNDNTSGTRSDSGTRTNQIARNQENGSIRTESNTTGTRNTTATDSRMRTENPYRNETNSTQRTRIEKSPRVENSSPRIETRNNDNVRSSSPRNETRSSSPRENNSNRSNERGSRR